MALLATAIGAMVGAGVFRLVADWLVHLHPPHSDGTIIDRIFETIVWFVFIGSAVLVLLLAVPAAATAVMLRLVGADRIGATVGWGLVAYVALGYVARLLHTDLPVAGALVGSFVAARVMIERRRHPPEAPPP